MPPDSDAPGKEPNLELPSFGFGRRKKRDKKPGEAVAPPAPGPTVVDPRAATAAALDAPRASRGHGLPGIKPLYAAVLTGVLSGLAAVLLAIGASRGCEALRDTSSCGGGLGLLATVTIVVIEVLAGAILLRAWQIPDPLSTSFLGVGLVAIIAMLTFLSHINSEWMLLVIPLLTAAAFALSWWVTVRIIDEYDADHPSGETRAPVTQDEDPTA